MINLHIKRMCKRTILRRRIKARLSQHRRFMPLRLVRFTTLLLAALALSLAREYPTVGNPFQVASIVGAVVLAVLARHRHRAFGWTVAAVVLLVGAILLPEWYHSPMAPAAAFVLQLAGLAAIVLSVLVEIPRRVGDLGVPGENPAASLLVIKRSRIAGSAPEARPAPPVEPPPVEPPPTTVRKKGRRKAPAAQPTV